MSRKESSLGETPQKASLPHTILLFDSDSGHRRRVMQLLAQRGHKVACHKDLQAMWAQRDSPACSCILYAITCDEAKDGLGVMDEMSSRGWRIPVILMADRCLVPQIVRLMNAGATAVVGKTDSPEELVATVEHALAEAERMREQDKISRNLAAKVESLSKRELEVVKMAAIGMKNKHIAEHLGLALITVKTHRANAMRKLEAGNIVQLTQIVIMAGLVNPTMMEGIVDSQHNGKGPMPRSGFPARRPDKRRKP